MKPQVSEIELRQGGAPNWHKVDFTLDDFLALKTYDMSRDIWKKGNFLSHN